MKVRLKTGAVVEIATARGLAYAQYTHRHDSQGALIRVLPGFWQKRPADISAVAHAKEQFWLFFPLQAAVNRDIVQYVGTVEVPEEARVFPLFKVPGLPEGGTGRVLAWGLWDGTTVTWLPSLPRDLWHLPERSIWNDTLLISRLEEGWTPELDVTRGWPAAGVGTPTVEAPPKSVESPSDGAAGGVRHFLYFRTQRAARQAAHAAEAGDSVVEVRRGDDGESWLVLVTTKVDDGRDPTDAEARLREVAATHGGEYDGWEVNVSG